MKIREFLNQKITNFRNNPKRAIVKTLSYWHGSSLDIYYLLILRLNYPSTYKILRSFRSGFALYGGAYKYVHLHRLLKQFNPRSILEFGSGSSTGVFAAYSSGKNVLIRTVENNEYWLNNTKVNIGDLANNVQFILAAAVSEKNYPSRCYYQFKDESKSPADLVYVDGPPLIVDGQEDVEAVNWNVVELIDSQFCPEVIVIDGRKSTVRYITEKFPNKYKVFLKSQHALFPGYRYHSFFVKIKDDN